MEEAPIAEALPTKRNRRKAAGLARPGMLVALVAIFAGLSVFLFLKNPFWLLAVELVFAIPGLGRYFVDAVHQLDYTVIMGTTTFYGAFLVFMVIVVDVLYSFIDPRVTLE